MELFHTNNKGRTDICRINDNGVKELTFEEIKDQEQNYMMHTYGRFEAALVKGKGATACKTNPIGA